MLLFHANVYHCNLIAIVTAFWAIIKKMFWGGVVFGGVGKAAGGGGAHGFGVVASSSTFLHLTLHLK